MQRCANNTFTALIAIRDSGVDHVAAQTNCALDRRRIATIRFLVVAA
jgi:hypothetical protein